MNWEKCFGDVPDFRMDRCKRHNLLDILAISICAVVCGADDFEEVSEYGRQKESFLRTFLELPNGIPSHDTFNRVFRYLDKEAFGNSLYRWSSEILSMVSQVRTQINIDGKVLRATARSGAKKSGICIVSAWASEHQLVLGQQQVDSKSNEKTAIPELLKSLDLTGTIVTVDAIACDLKNADLIVSKGGNYILALKKNNKLMHEQVSSRLKQVKSQLTYNKDIDFGSGRIEKRTCYVENNLGLYDDLRPWKHLKSIVMVEAERETKGKTSFETRYYLCNLNLQASEFNKLIRNHWSIENKLHWKLDVVFNEDAQKTKIGNAPQNLATIRKFALQLINRMEDKESIKNRRKMAGWNDRYLLKILQKL